MDLFSEGSIMAKEWIDVVDTAIKIGLGSLIASIAAHQGRKQTQRENKEKNIKETISTCMNELSNYLNSFEHLIQVSFEPIDDAEEIYDEQLESIEKMDSIYRQEICNRNLALNRLRLLGQTKAVDKINTIDKKLIAIRDRIVIDNILLKHTEYKSLDKKINQYKDSIFSELSDIYMKG